MQVIGFVANPESAEAVVSWAQAFCDEASTVEFLCWDRVQESATLDAVRVALGDLEAEVAAVDDADVVARVVRRCREAGANLLVTSAFQSVDLPDQNSKRLINAAPCRAMVGYFGDPVGQNARRALVVASGGAHDRALLDLVRQPGLQATVVGIEADIGEQSEEVGRRILEQSLRDAKLENAEHIDMEVVVSNNRVRGIRGVAEGYDVVLLGLDQRELVLPLRRVLGGASVALVKREPPLRRRAVPDWLPQIHPADYVELIQNLRAGSRWGADFIVMLAMASAIASLGLLQDSPAVVIGAMLVAPLMTPMIGFGLSVVQANPRLALLAGKTIAKGILVTLGISFLTGFAIPGGELLSQETLARGSPNILDLGIALFAAVAAAFALVRPGISGAIAGVAIATALVPPLCAVGISLAYANWLNAFGAAALFMTNLFAIVLASSLTFFLMGVTPARSLARYQRLAQWVATALVAVLLIFSIPLTTSLGDRITSGSVRPLGYPVKRSLARGIQARVAQESGVELMFMGRSSAVDQVVIYVASDKKVSRKLQDDLVRLVRDEMENDELEVHVFAVQLVWKD